MPGKNSAGKPRPPADGIPNLRNTLRDLLLAAFFSLLTAFPAIAGSDTLPEPSAMSARLKSPAVLVRVIEPHLSTGEAPAFIQYRGWPAELILDQWLGSAWRSQGVEIEFRARDGYVSHIPAERFRKYRAYLVFERDGHPSFSVDNTFQNEREVPLGPYYLIWDNIRNPDLLADGGTYWPYQVTQLRVVREHPDALLPTEMNTRYAESAALAKKYCASCHQINGYGGHKWPANLAQVVKTLTAKSFMQWTLQPEQAKPGTAMPGLPATLPANQREKLARQLFEYFMALPVVH